MLFIPVYGPGSGKIGATVGRGVTKKFSDDVSAIHINSISQVLFSDAAEGGPVQEGKSVQVYFMVENIGLCKGARTFPSVTNAIQFLNGDDWD